MKIKKAAPLTDEIEDVGFYEVTPTEDGCKGYVQFTQNSRTNPEVYEQVNDNDDNKTTNI